MDKIAQAVTALKTPATIRKIAAASKAKAAKKARAASAAAKDRRIVGDGSLRISPAEALDLWKVAVPGQPRVSAAASSFARRLELVAMEASNASGKLPLNEARQLGKVERLLRETRGMSAEDDKGEEGRKKPSCLVVDVGSGTPAGACDWVGGAFDWIADRGASLAPTVAGDWIAELESVVARTKRRHRIADAFQKEAGGGVHKVFALHLYLAVKRLGWCPKLRRDVDRKPSGPFVEFARAAWAVCFPGASEMPPRTVEQVIREKGAFAAELRAVAHIARK